MTDDLYERYKEALRAGHVAALRGRLEEALEAYRLAAQLAPARAMPHSSLGGIYLRLNRLDEALAEYAAAVARSPQDEGALLGQAEALEVVGRYSDAAVALDRVAQIQEAAGRVPEAADTLRRGLELDESPERVRRQRSLVRQIRLSAGDQAAEQALARALRLREPAAEDSPAMPAPQPVAPPQQPRIPGASRMGANLEAAAAAWRQPVREAAPPPTADPTPLPSSAPQPESPAPAQAAAAGVDDEAYELALRIAALGGDPAAQPEPEPGESAPEIEFRPEMPIAAAAIVELEVEPMPDAPARPSIDEWPAADRLVVKAPERSTDLASPEPAVPAVAPEREPIGVIDVPDEQRRAAAISLPAPSGDELIAAAEQTERAGDAGESRRLLVSAARAYSNEGRFEAALDTAHQVLRHHPADVDGHLVLVELYVSRRWDSLAAEKLLLLGRLADLDGDEATKARLCDAASRAFPANGRLAALCS